jgi:hypothetical protein
MSAGATPSALISETSALAAFALSAIASPAVFPMFVTTSVTGAKSGAALTLPSLRLRSSKHCLCRSNGRRPLRGRSRRALSGA